MDGEENFQGFQNLKGRQVVFRFEGPADGFSGLKGRQAVFRFEEPAEDFQV